MKTGTSYSFFNRLSIQQRLPLLICLLLLVCVSVYGFANYYSLRKADMTIGRDRLQSLTTQMNTAFGQAGAVYLGNASFAAKDKAIVRFLKANGSLYPESAHAILDKLKPDTTWVLAQLLDKNFKPVLSSGNQNATAQLDLRKVVQSANLSPGATTMTKLYRTNKATCYPLISAVADNGNTIGYLIAWKSVLTTKKAVAQVSQLLGVGAIFYIGNKDGSLWTDFIHPVDNVPFKYSAKQGLIDYIADDGSHMEADVQPIAGTGLLFGIALSEKNMLKDLDDFIKWIVILGVLIIITGVAAAVTMSRSITKPLNELISAATAISQGNYTTTVPIDKYQDDEVGRLANVFNAMIGHVSRSHHELEIRVEERTLQLEHVNKELEAFSYSVSHDLRTPLRAINGYSVILKEDYETELDSEGQRIIKNIITNAKMMGALIDDLLTFARLGKKELLPAKIDMQLITETVVRDLLQNEPAGKYEISIGPLPDAIGDETMIRQVLLNLIGNAVKYSSKKNEPKIEIDTTGNDGRRTVYYVRDNGAGFNMAYSSKLFGVFQRLHAIDDFEGSGVGLALVKRIIEKHNGEVWAEGIENQGATFYFSLPKF